MHSPKKWLLLTMAFAIPNLSLAKHVLPTFSGQWFANAKLSRIDACGQAQYQYSPIGSNPEQLVLQLLPAEIASNCQWQAFSAKSLATKPEGFVGSDADWQALSTGNIPHSTQWRRNCRDASGNIVKSQQIIIHPQFQCPKDSRFDFSATDVGCNTTPTPCLGDVVGHDFFIKPVSPIGHIAVSGLAKLSNQSETIVEVTNNQGSTFDQFVRETQFTDFKLANKKFWGEKYGVKAQSETSLQDGYRILNAAISEENFVPIYTPLWDWEAGDYHPLFVYDADNNYFLKQHALIQSRFRCDSFVVHSYQRAKLDLNNQYKFPEVPATVFGSLSNKRLIDTTVPDNAPAAFKLAHGPMNSAMLRTKLNNPTLAADDLAASLQSYIQNPVTSRESKLKELWEFAKEHQENLEKYLYLLYSLDSLKPIELTDELLMAYYSTSRPEVKHFLLRVLGDCVRSEDEEQARKLALNYKDEIAKIGGFLLEVINVNENQFFVREAIMLLPMTMPIELAYDGLQDAQQNIPDAFSETEWLSIRLAYALADIKSQQAYLTDVLDAAAKGSPKQQQIIAENLSVWLRHIDSSMLSPDAQTAIVAYLQGVLTRMPDPTLSNVYNARKIYLSQQAIARIESHDPNQYLANQIYQYPSSLQGYLIFVADDEIIMHWDYNQRKQLADNLRAQLMIDNSKDSLYLQAALLRLGL